MLGGTRCDQGRMQLGCREERLCAVGAQYCSKLCGMREGMQRIEAMDGTTRSSILVDISPNSSPPTTQSASS